MWRRGREGGRKGGEASTEGSVLVPFLHFLHDKVCLAGRDAGSLLTAAPPPAPTPPFALP